MPCGDDLCKLEKLCLLYRICVACNIICNSMYSITVLNCCVYGGHVQRQKNLGSRVALLPGKFLRVRKVFARINEKTF